MATRSAFQENLRLLCEDLRGSRQRAPARLTHSPLGFAAVRATLLQPFLTFEPREPHTDIERLCSPSLRLLARVATTSLLACLPRVMTPLRATTSERGECILAMLFWIVAALAVVATLGLVWLLYLLARRWL